MTHAQLDALLGLLNPREGKTRDVLRMVFVEGMPQAEAARQLGMTRPGLGATVQRARKIIALAEALVAPAPAA